MVDIGTNMSADHLIIQPQGDGHVIVTTEGAGLSPWLVGNFVAFSSNVRDEFRFACGQVVKVEGKQVTVCLYD